MKRKVQSLLFLVMVIASPALATQSWYASTPTLFPDSTAGTLGASVTLTPPMAPYKYLDPISISFIVDASDGETVTIQTTATWANGYQAVVNTASHGGEVDLTPMEVSQLGLGRQKCNLRCTNTNPFDGNSTLATGRNVQWSFAVQSDQPNSAATVNYLVHFEMY